MVRPDDESDDGNADTGRGDEAITKNRLTHERWNDFRNHTHGRKNHDVHGWMRIKPEHMLEKDRIAAVSRVKKSQMKHPLESCEQERDGDDRGAQNENQAGGV